MAPLPRSRNFTQFLMLLSVISYAGCKPDDPALVAHPRSKTSFNRLTGEDLSGFPDVYSAVKTLRGSWLTGRGDPPRSPRIYVDGVLASDIGALSAIVPREVRELRYMSSYEATSRYGSTSLGGVIEIIMRQ